MFYLSLLIASLFVCPPSSAAQTITAQQAKAAAGQTVTVCRSVRRVRTAMRSPGAPTSVSFDEGEFTALIWPWPRHRFGDLRTKIGREAGVSGRVREYRGKAQMTLIKAEQWQQHD